MGIKLVGGWARPTPRFFRVYKCQVVYGVMAMTPQTSPDEIMVRSLEPFGVHSIAPILRSLLA